MKRAKTKPVKPAKRASRKSVDQGTTPRSTPWKVVLTKLEREFSTEAEARGFFDLRSRSLAAGERLAIIKHPA